MTKILQAAILLLTTTVVIGAPPAPLPFAAASGPEQQTISKLLDSEHWTFRVFALLRLERYAGEEVEAMLTTRLADESWAVRAFAIRATAVLGMTPAADTLASETDGRVIRTALRYGFAVPGPRVEQGTRALLRTRGVDELLLGLEIASYCEAEAIRAEANRRASLLIRNMDDAVAVRVSARLARALAVEGEPPSDRNGWLEWVRTNGRDELLGAPPAAGARPGGVPVPGFVAELESEAFDRLINYLNGLRSRDLDLVIVMDATTSMLPMINETRAGVESLILFMNDLSRSMRLGFVAYRDHDNEPVWEGHEFTSDVESVRDFLFRIRITGGRDLPEAVLEGLSACRELDWNRSATRQIILVGDAQPHDRDAYAVTSLMESYAEAGVTVHAVHVPMVPSEQYTSRLHPAAASAYRAEIAEHNRRTESAFVDIADAGAGEKIGLQEAADLVPAIMHLTIDETWWPVFDEFYARYLELCR